MAGSGGASAGAAHAAPAKRLGDLVVERGIASRAHVEICVEYQNALRAHSNAEPKRLGEILVQKGLLKPDQLDALLQEQRERDPDWMLNPANIAAQLGTGPKPRKRAASKPEQPRRPMPRWVRYLAMVPLLAVGAIVVGCLWPGPPAQRTLETYLRGRSESAAQSADYLAVRELDISVFHFRVEALPPAVEHDYAPDLRQLIGRPDLNTWADFPRAANLLGDKRRALEFILPGLPTAIKHHPVDSLIITVQPIRASLFYRRAGEHLYRHERCLFHLVRVDSPWWSFGWRVAAYESLEPPSPE